MAKIKWASVPTVIRWNKLKALRKERRLSQPQVAVGAGLAISTIYFLELGYEERTTEETRQKLASFFECDVDDLFPVDMIGDVPREEYLKSFQPKKAK
jgi:transcriptional regulator with XRE-family HTH domain